MSTDAPHTVVLAGGSLASRQALANQLQQHLHTLSPDCIFICPASPQALSLAPANAKYLLWRDTQDSGSNDSHNAWRTQLHTLQRPYQSLQADPQTLFQQAVYALTPGLSKASARAEITGRWQGLCECCADPACEQKLFDRLLQG